MGGNTSRSAGHYDGRLKEAVHHGRCREVFDSSILRYTGDLERDPDGLSNFHPMFFTIVCHNILCSWRLPCRIHGDLVPHCFLHCEILWCPVPSGPTERAYLTLPYPETCFCLLVVYEK